jgi:hypothetical protein
MNASNDKRGQKVPLANEKHCVLMAALMPEVNPN